VYGVKVSNPAGFWVRLGASLLDSIVLAIVVAIIGLIIGFTYGDNTGSLLEFILNLCYTLILPVLWYGFTVGKKALGIRVVKLDGSDISFGTNAKRILLGSLVYLLTLGIGFIVSAFMVGMREDKRSIHDLIAGTYVTYDQPESEQKV
jgi:uncharacterized RDD family membrane protein YckC